ncbi:hypothetical protein ACGFYQ_30355 [Streptomyces sp. NPDC048258]|uniref:hypothetical protein n=1 Tax=Streptomyces sp. NPDC048258 TaxID=3365527 RepID=UPI0037199279
MTPPDAAPALSLTLTALGLVDSAFSGFRAYAGRDARIRKHRAVVRAALRGLAVGGALLLAPVLTAGGVLLAAADRARTYAALTEGGIGYLGPLACYALAVLLSLAAYFVLPFRAATLAMVAGLGPLTLLRPLVVAAACVGAFARGGGVPALLVGTVAGVAVLCVEPLVHRRWYSAALTDGPTARS